MAIRPSPSINVDDQVDAGPATTETGLLIRWLSSLKYDDLSAPALEKAKDLFLDFAGYATFGSAEEPARILNETFQSMGGSTEATVIGRTGRIPIVNAAFVNGASGHAAELDDTHRGTQSHPGDSVLAAALAVAEYERSNGPDFIAATVAGYEAAIRVGESVMPSHYLKGWHPTGTINTFGAAVAAGKLMGLDEAHLTQAVAIACGQAAGNFAHLDERGMLKDFNPGRAAANGVLAAHLARTGFTGASDAIGNRRGFGALYSDEYQPQKLVEDMGEPYKLTEVAHKQYPGCRHLHSARDALLRILNEEFDGRLLDPGCIERLTARIYPVGAAYVDDPEPWAPGKGIYGPSFSAQFNLALILQEGEDGLRRLLDPEYALRKLNDPGLRELISRIHVVHDPGLDGVWPDGWPSEVTLVTGSNSHTRRVDLPKGEPENPMSAQEMEDKFILLTEARGFPRDRCERLMEAVRGLEQVSDLAEVARLLGAG